MPSPPAASAPTREHPDVLAAVRDGLPMLAAEGLADWAAGVERLAGVGEVRVGAQSVTVKLAPPIAAETVARALGLSRPYAVSGDVHQRSWSIRLWSADIDDPHGRRIATTSPRFGAWEVDLRLSARPEAPLPDLVAGASPAYDLTQVAAEVVSIEVTRAP